MRRILQLLLTLSLVAVPALARDSNRLDGPRRPPAFSLDEPSFFTDLISNPLTRILVLAAAVVFAFLVWFVWWNRRTDARFKRMFGCAAKPRYPYKADLVREKLRTLEGDELRRAEELAGICDYEDCTSIGGYQQRRM